MVYKQGMKARHAAALALVGFVLAVAILIYALMPGYYLIFASPGANSTVVQLGPFVTQAACESARHRLAEIIFGNSDLVSKEALEKMSRFTVCISSR
jgi:hypothetical protein